MRLTPPFFRIPRKKAAAVSREMGVCFIKPLAGKPGWNSHAVRSGHTTRYQLRAPSGSVLLRYTINIRRLTAGFEVTTPLPFCTYKTRQRQTIDEEGHSPDTSLYVYEAYLKLRSGVFHHTPRDEIRSRSALGIHIVGHKIPSQVMRRVAYQHPLRHGSSLAGVCARRGGISTPLCAPT